MRYMILVIPMIVVSCGSAPKIETSKKRGDQISSGANLDYKNGKFQSALSRYRDAYSEYSKIDSLSDIARTAGNISVLLFVLGELDESLDYSMKSVALYERLQDENGYYSQLINQITVLIELGRFDEALIALRKCESYSKNKTSLGFSLVYLHKGDLILAKEMAEHAMLYYESIKSKDGIAAANLVLAKIFRVLSQTEDAISYAERALNTDKLSSNSLGVLKDLIELGEIYKALDLKLSNEYFERALLSARSLNRKSDIEFLVNKIGPSK